MAWAKEGKYGMTDMPVKAGAIFLAGKSAEC